MTGKCRGDLELRNGFRGCTGNGFPGISGERQLEKGSGTSLVG